MGSSAVLGIPRAPHRAPTIWEGLVEYSEELQEAALRELECVICEKSDCPGAQGRACTYELEACQTCFDIDCIGSHGHTCPTEGTCTSCGFIHPGFLDCSLQADKKLCDDCHSRVCAVNPPRDFTRAELDSQIEDAYDYSREYYFDDPYADDYYPSDHLDCSPHADFEVDELPEPNPEAVTMTVEGALAGYRNGIISDDDMPSILPWLNGRHFTLISESRP